MVTTIAECQGCHGDGLSGQPFFDDPAVGTVSSSNLTGGAGGVGATYTDEDWVRAIRHGVGPDGRPLLVMPSRHFHNMSEQDLAATIAYVKSVPPVDNVPPESQLSFLAYVLTALGEFDDAFSYDLIDHDEPFQQAPPEGSTVEYGEYLVSISTCRDCHGNELAGGQAGPGEPIGPNLTPGGELAGWTEEDFITLIRTGVAPDGREINPFMPWQFYREMTDTELQAIWAYLQSLPALEYQGPPIES